jgi:hypothetical protein
MSSARVGPTWATDTTAPVLARLLAAHADCAGAKDKAKAQWHHVQLPALKLQMKAMEETLSLLEREMESAAANLAEAEALEKKGGRSSIGTPADFELNLGALEDKALRMTQDLDQLRRLTFFPEVEGYTLRVPCCCLRADAAIGVRRPRQPLLRLGPLLAAPARA